MKVRKILVGLLMALALILCMIPSGFVAYAAEDTYTPISVFIYGRYVTKTDYGYGTAAEKGGWRITWKDDKSPTIDVQCVYATSDFYTDIECKNMLDHFPKENETVYLKSEIRNNISGDQSFDFSSLSKENCTLSLNGYNTECADVRYVWNTAFEIQQCYLIFSVTKSSDNVYAPTWVTLSATGVEEKSNSSGWGLAEADVKFEWDQQLEPDQDSYFWEIGNLCTDPSCQTKLAEEPVENGVYYFETVISNTSSLYNNRIDYSTHLKTGFEKVPGYTAECVSKEAQKRSGKDCVSLIYKLRKNVVITHDPADSYTITSFGVAANEASQDQHGWGLGVFEQGVTWLNNNAPFMNDKFAIANFLYLYTDTDLTNKLDHEPEVNESYYLQIELRNAVAGDRRLDFSLLSNNNIHLTVQGYSTECVRIDDGFTPFGDSEIQRCILYFKVVKDARFKTQPKGGVIRAGESHKVRWSTSFTPVRLERFRDGTRDKTYGDPTITSEEISGAGTYTYRAWYGMLAGEYVDSNEFKISGIYVITFLPKGGTVSPTSMETNADGKLNSLPTPTRDQYNFKGWLCVEAEGIIDKNYVFTKNTSLIATWERKTYTVSFNANGGEVSPRSMTTGVDGKLSSLPTPTLTGYDFLYWRDVTTLQQVGLDRVYTGNASLIAKWEKKSYTVSFDTNGGTAIDSQTVKYCDKAERPTAVPKKSGWLFVDWYKDEACTTKFNFNSQIKENTIIYAKWVEGYRVYFHAKGASPSFFSVDVLKGQTVSRPIDPTRALHVFDGWYMNANCSGDAFDFNTPIENDVNLNAKWLPQVVYDMGGHGENVTRTLNPGDFAEELKLQDEGYQFNGWYLDADWSVPFDFTQPVNEGVILYAAWAKEIEGVSLGFKELAVGSYIGMNNNYVSLSISKKDSGNYALPSKATSWQKDGTDATLNNSQVVEGHPYTACFTLTANPGYVFPELVTDAQKAAFLSMEGEFAGLVVTYPANGAMTGDTYLTFALNEDADPRIAHTKLTVTLTYVPRLLTINSVEFMFTEPLAGQAYDSGYNRIEFTKAEDAPFGITVYQNGWRMEGTDSGETTFVKGNTYVGTLLLTAKPGFQFRQTSGNQSWAEYVRITRLYGGQTLPCGAGAFNPTRFEVVRQWTEYGNSNILLDVYYVVEQKDLEMIIDVTHDDDAFEIIYAVDDEGMCLKAANELCNDQDYLTAWRSNRSSIQCKWYVDGELYATTNYNAAQGKGHEVHFGPEDAGKSLYVVMTYGQKTLTSETMTIDALDVRTVKFVLGERCTGSAPETQYVKPGEQVTKPTAPQTVSGWKFVGWAENATQGDLYDFDAAVTENLTLYARVIKLVSVTFQANGGSGSMEVVTVGQGEQLELPACGFTAPEGYEFDCWRIGSVNYLVGARVTIPEDRYVKAIWKEATPNDESLKIAKRSLTLYDTIAIEFKVEKAVIDAGYHDPYLEVTQNGVRTKLSDYALSADGTLYVFTVRIAPHQMGDAVTVVLHALNAGGEDVKGVPMEYSVAKYCKNMLNNANYQKAEYAKLRRLLVDILLYGDAAQLYVGYKTDELVSSFLTDEQRAMGTDVTAEMNYTSVRKKNCVTVENPLASIETAALFLEAAVNIQFKYEASELTGLRVVVTEDEAGTNVLGEYPADASLIDGNGRYYVTFDYLNAAQMRKTVYATVMKGSEKVSNTFRYSIESYAYSMTGREGYETLDLLLNAMMRYGDSAAAYVSNN